MKYAVRNEQTTNNVPYMGNPYIKMIEEKLNDEFNNFCVECGNENPEYISINNGIFICINCVQNHFKFPKIISNILKNNIKSLTLDEIQPLLCGGNKSLLDFINNEYPKLSEFPPHILYRTQAMVYYRQNLQYLINGGIPPVKPSIKYAYKISNFCQNYSNNNIMTTDDDFYIPNPTSDSKTILSNDNYKHYDKFYHSVNNFWNGRNTNRNRNNIDNFENNKYPYTINNGENNYENYIISKPNQVNFQNNNNIIIGNIDDNHKNKIIYSPQKIKIDYPKNKRNKLNKQNNQHQMEDFNSMTRYSSNLNEVYVKPKLILSPKVINNFENFTLSNRNINNRHSSVDLNKKNYFISQNNELFEKGEILCFPISNIKDNVYETVNNNWKCRKMNKNFSQGSYNKNPIKYIKKTKIIHKSLSQKVIKEDNNHKEKYIPKPNKNSMTIRLKKVITNKINKKVNQSDNDETKMKKTLHNANTKSYINNNKIISNFMKNNEKCSTEDTNNFSEVDSLPIKINLKIKKDKEIHEEQKQNEKNYFSSDESKKEPKQNDKKEDILIKKDSKNNIIPIPKDNKKEEVKNEKKNNIPKRPPSRVFKNRSHEDDLKISNITEKKMIENKIKNLEKNNISIRNKYKLKNKSKY